MFWELALFRTATLPSKVLRLPSLHSQLLFVPVITVIGELDSDNKVGMYESETFTGVICAAVGYGEIG